MEINIFNDPNKVPQPRDKVKIELVEVTPYPDRYRVHVQLNVTMFQERPNLLLVMRTAAGQLIQELNVIETMHAEMEFTIHIRGVEDPAGEYVLDVEMFYETRQPPHDSASVTFSIPEDDD